MELQLFLCRFRQQFQNQKYDNNRNCLIRDVINHIGRKLREEHSHSSLTQNCHRKRGRNTVSDSQAINEIGQNGSQSTADQRERKYHQQRLWKGAEITSARIIGNDQCDYLIQNGIISIGRIVKPIEQIGKETDDYTRQISADCGNQNCSERIKIDRKFHGSRQIRTADIENNSARNEKES